MDFGSTIIGVCRFSYLGVGDWRAMHRDRNGRSLDEIMEDNRKILFRPERLEKRFATFENLTIPSLAAQTDKKFVFLTLTSDELPSPYRTRLDALAERHPFMRVLYKPVDRASKIFNEEYAEMGHNLPDVLQFRLDDDDAVSRSYIKELRKFGQAIAAADGGRNFSITHPSVLFAAEINGNVLLRKRHYIHTSAGQAMRHKEKNVLEWAHHLVDRSVMTLADPHQWVLQTALSGINDSGAVSEATLRGRQVTEISPDGLEGLIKRHFPFVSSDADFWRKFID